MLTFSKARAAIQALDLVQGLPIEEVHERLAASLRLGDVGQRGLAFYLYDMASRLESSASGHRSVVFYAETRLGLSRRRAYELLHAGRRLLDLPEVDAAFCRDEINWSKVLLLLKVVTPEIQDEWLACARQMTCRELDAEVRRRKFGQAPRDNRGGRGIHEVHFKVAVNVNTLVREKLRRAKEKLCEELGRPVGDEEFLESLADLQLSFENDGTVPGRKRVPCSRYQIVLRPEEIDRIDKGRLVVDTDDGPVPLDPDDGEEGAGPLSAAMWCDAEIVVVNDYVEGGAHDELDRKTPEWLRRKVLARDGHRCRCCGKRTTLQVHHIAFRSLGGRTVASNLLAACEPCHSLVHAGLLVLQGRDAEHVRFLDAAGKPLHEPAQFVSPDSLLPLALPRLSPESDEPAAPAPLPVTLDDVPEAIDGTWWRRHADLIAMQRGKGLAFRPGVPRAEAPPSPAAKNEGESLEELVGQDRRIARLAEEAEGARLRGRPFPHALFEGPSGTGKTTLARCVAEAYGAELRAKNGPLLADTHALVRALAELEEGDVLLIDEIHAVAPAVLEVLYDALSDGHLDLTFSAGARSRSVRFELPSFTLLAATTEGGRLPQPLLSRFGLREVLARYEVEDLAELAMATAAQEEVTIERDAALHLAACAQGTPRETSHLIDRVLNVATARRQETVDGDAMDEVLSGLGYDREGLNPLQQLYLRALRQSQAPMALARLASVLGIDTHQVEREVEPELLRRGLVQVTWAGRQAIVGSQARKLGISSADVRQLKSRFGRCGPRKAAGGEGH